MSGTEFLDRKQAAAWLTAKGIHTSVSALNKWAVQKIGPDFVRPNAGRTFYPVESLEAWLTQIHPGRAK